MSQEDVQKLQDKQLANVIRKLNGGKTLTAKEEALLAQAREGDAKAAPGGYAKTWDELADAGRVDRRTLTNFRKDLAIEIKRRGSSLTRADGRHAIAAWSALLDECGLERRGVNAELSGKTALESDGLPSKYTLQKRELALKLERQEFELAKEKENMLEVGHFEHALGAMLSQFRQTLDALPTRCAGKLADIDVRNSARELMREVLGKVRSAKNEDEAMQIIELQVVRLLPEPDYHFRVATITTEVEIAKRVLRECRYLEAAETTLTAAAGEAAEKALEASEADEEE